MSSIYGNNRSSYTQRIPSALRGAQTLTVESRSRDGGNSASNFSVNLSVPIQCQTNQAIGYYLKEAHIPISNWTVNTGYDSFQIAFPYDAGHLFEVKLKHGSYTASAFAQMVEDALNIVTYDESATSHYKRHIHKWPDSLDVSFASLKTLVNAAILEYNVTSLPKKTDGTSTDIVEPIDDSTGEIDSPISFKVHYNEEVNRFSISR